MLKSCFLVKLQKSSVDYESSSDFDSASRWVEVTELSFLGELTL